MGSYCNAVICGLFIFYFYRIFMRWTFSITLKSRQSIGTYNTTVHAVAAVCLRIQTVWYHNITVFWNADSSSRFSDPELYGLEQ